MSKDKKKISKDMTFAEIMELDEDAGRKLGERGLFCGGCPMAAFETLEGGAAKHGVDVNQLLRELNEDGSNSGSSDGSSVKDGSHSADGSATPGACESGEVCDEE